MRGPQEWPFRRIGYAVAIGLLILGILLLLVALTREYRDVQRLWLFAFGYLFTGAGAVTALAVAVGPHGRRVLALLGVAAGGAVVGGVVVLAWVAAQSPDPLHLDSLDDAPAGVPVPQPAPQAPEPEERSGAPAQAPPEGS